MVNTTGHELEIKILSMQKSALGTR